jgi:hypothetical protein
MDEEIKIVYTDHLGETTIRSIIPGEIYFGSDEAYPEQQWLMRAVDNTVETERTFAINEIRFWYLN